MTAGVRHVLRDGVLEIYVAQRPAPASVFSFVDAGLSERVGAAFARAFVALQGANTLESQRAAWGLLQKFAAFASEVLGKPDRLPIRTLADYDAWMSKRGLSEKVTGQAHNAVVRVIRWCIRNAPNCVDRRIALYPLPNQSRGRVSSKRASQDEPPDENLLRGILSACYAEIESIEQRIDTARQLLMTEEPSELADLLWFLLSTGDGVVPSQRKLLRTRGGATALIKLRQHGGLRGVSGMFYLSIKDVFAFYLAILVQTSGNPQSLLAADADCILPVPLRDDLERVVWEKRRAGREQAPDFPKNKAWAAPNLVRRLRSLNDELRPIAPKRWDSSLFLCRSVQGLVTSPSWQRIHDMFKAFRKRHNLPAFDLRDLRRAGGKLHHQAGRSIAIAQQRLQHSSAATTEIYTPSSDIRQQHGSVILHFQGLLISESRKVTARMSADRMASPEVGAVETVFGFGCKDPLAGIAPGSRQGEVCTRFHQCATCPGALIVVDDPECVARIGNTASHLVRERERAVKQGWSSRFDALYGPTLTILKRDILPAVSKPTLDVAEGLSVPPLPPLE